jgi:hypothetical protein
VISPDASGDSPGLVLPREGAKNLHTFFLEHNLGGDTMPSQMYTKKRILKIGFQLAKLIIFL